MTRRRSSRSARVPPSRPASAGRKSPASSRNATARACPVVSATWSIRATRPSESPRKDTARALHSRRNGRLAPSSRSDPPPAGPRRSSWQEILPDRPQGQGRLAAVGTRGDGADGGRGAGAQRGGRRRPARPGAAAAALGQALQSPAPGGPRRRRGSRPGPRAAGWGPCRCTCPGSPSAPSWSASSPPTTSGAALPPGADRAVRPGRRHPGRGHGRHPHHRRPHRRHGRGGGRRPGPAGRGRAGHPRRRRAGPLPPGRVPAGARLPRHPRGLPHPRPRRRPGRRPPGGAGGRLVRGGGRRGRRGLLLHRRPRAHPGAGLARPRHPPELGRGQLRSRARPGHHAGRPGLRRMARRRRQPATGRRPRAPGPRPRHPHRGRRGPRRHPPRPHLPRRAHHLQVDRPRRRGRRRRRPRLPPRPGSGSGVRVSI